MQRDNYKEKERVGNASSKRQNRPKTSSLTQRSHLQTFFIFIIFFITKNSYLNPENQLLTHPLPSTPPKTTLISDPQPPTNRQPHLPRNTANQTSLSPASPTLTQTQSFHELSHSNTSTPNCTPNQIKTCKYQIEAL